ncbi:hypothetical protein CesoFtcFv8_000491 [Champsocephalus esox]|uniref:Transmembrane protein n=1 Tax=Champsocephalus esox TaxID=159716 RepID=A0AAN8HGV5_9TELE|nr:hypothetical protein CesoFtcFv8_000491 [Champsocephalus esox]
MINGAETLLSWKLSSQLLPRRSASPSLRQTERIMAPVGSEVDVFLSSGVFFFVLLVFLSIFLTALCSECSRRSFELRDPTVNKDPSSIIRVVKLEDAMVARENPMIAEIQNDEKDSVSFTPWRSHLAAPQHHPDVQTPETPDHICITNGGRGGGDDEEEMENSVYAQVSKKVRPNPEGQQEVEQEVEQEVPSPPLPDRKSDLED